MRRDKRSRRSTNNFLPGKPSAQDPGFLEEPSDSKPLDEEEEEVMAALGMLNPPGRNPYSKLNPQERRRTTSATRYYGCGQFGQFKSDCPRLNRQKPRRFTPRAKLECILCKGDHFVRNCVSLSAAQQATERIKQVRETEL